MASIDLQTFTRIAKPVLAEGYPVLIRGRHGIGKSESAYQIARGLGEYMKLEVPDLKVVELRASQMNEGDLLGLPFLENDATVFKPPAWFKECQECACLLLLDEINRASPQVKQALMQLTDSHALAGKPLHPDTRIIGAVNSGVEYNVGDMDPAELDRWVVWDVSPTLEDWTNWAKQKVFLSFDKTKGFIEGDITNVEELIVEFVNHNPDTLEWEGSFNPDEVYPSRRSWKRFSDVYRSSGLNFYKKTDHDFLFNLISGFVGNPIAVRFREFVGNLEEQYSAEDVVNGVITAKQIENLSVPRQRSLVNRMMKSVYVKERLPEEQAENLAAAFLALNMEIKAYYLARHINVEDDVRQCGTHENFDQFRNILGEELPALAKQLGGMDLEDPLAEDSEEEAEEVEEDAPEPTSEQDDEEVVVPF